MAGEGPGFPQFFIAGTWKNWTKESMVRDGACFHYVVEIGRETGNEWEAFTIFQNGDSNMRIHPSVKNADPTIDYELKGPHAEGEGFDWLIGENRGNHAFAMLGDKIARMSGASIKGIKYQIKLFVDSTGRVERVTWEEHKDAGVDLTRVDPSRFEIPVSRLNVSGGTAPFFALALRGTEAQQKSPTYYIGKDLSHTQDEVLFYEEALCVSKRKTQDQGGLEKLLSFMFEYDGILTAPEKDAASEQDKPLDMLVLRNLFDGCKALRMLDIKVGEKTASGGWYGKSHIKAIWRDFVDGCTTNSGAEGFRLAGFNGWPPSLSSRNPLLDCGGGSPSDEKKAWRMVFGMMSGADMFAYLLDVHQEPADPGDASLDEVLAPSEVTEVSLHEIVKLLVSLVVACRRVRVPQKWVGSSIATAFDSGHLPPRPTGEAALRQAVRVHVFDWGRSELNTPEKHSQLTATERADRELYWDYYMGGVDRLAWEAACAYKHRFGNALDWGRTVCVQIYDFDSMSSDDFLHKVELPLEEVSDQTVKLGSGDATLIYSIKLRNFPEGSRLHKAWRVCLHKAEKISIGDQIARSSDPYVVLTAKSENGSFEFQQQSTIKFNTLDPEWNETFELPVSRRPGEEKLREALNYAAEGLGDVVITSDLDTLLPSPQCRDAAEKDRAVSAWVEKLDKIVGKEAGTLGHKQQRATVMSSTADAVRGVGEMITGGYT